MKLQEDILKISREEKKTIIFVTHDIEEAVFLADRIVVMMADPGRIKSVVKVPLGDHRDRTSEDFLYVRDKIFELFNMKSDGLYRVLYLIQCIWNVDISDTEYCAINSRSIVLISTILLGDDICYR